MPLTTHTPRTQELTHALARKARIYAELAGYGLSSDAHHMTAPRADGSGPFLAMQRALRHAGATPDEVDYVNAHATSTPLGDAAENAAIQALLLGEGGWARAGDISVSSVPHEELYWRDNTYITEQSTTCGLFKCGHDINTAIIKISAQSRWSCD